MMASVGRLQDGSSSIRITAGNQAAEGSWGTAKSLQKAQCTHRGAATSHAAAHAACASYMAQNPGLQSLGHAWAAWYCEHLDSDDPQGFFTRSGWTGKGPYCHDPDTVRLCLGRFDVSEIDGIELRRAAKQPRAPKARPGR